MKAILVLNDMPKNCGDCPCVCDEFAFCQADEKNRDCDWYKIPSWCPLRPLPKKLEPPTEYDWNTDEEYVWGWNHCLLEITGETE